MVVEVKSAVKVKTQVLPDGFGRDNRAPVRATGAQDSRRILSNIIVYNYDTTHLQENPQRLG